MNRKTVAAIVLLSTMLFTYKLVTYPLMTLKAAAFVLISVPLAYLVLAGFKLILRPAISEISPEKVKRLACRKAGLRRFSVCFSGIDGSGKTTQASELTRYLRSLGFKVTQVWGRWPAFMSYLVLGVGKLLGFHAKIKDPSGYIRVIPRYHKLGVLAKFYVLFMLVDIHLWYFRVKARNFRSNVIVFDRFVLDILTDLTCETTGQRLVNEFGLLARTYVISARKMDLLIVFDLDPLLAYKRKVDISLSELQSKRDLFSFIASRSSAYLVDASESADLIASQVKQIFRERLES